MKIVVTGGGSGGHITPALAVAHELKQLRPEAEISYIGQRGDSLNDVPETDKNIDAVYTVRAGKFRRYHTEGWRQLLDVATLFKNLRDIVWILVGTWQSFWLLGRLKPQVIFTRGSYVSVPVCWAAALRGIPYITHDSDAIPSLANRLIAPWAKLHAVALPKELYPDYPPKKTLTVGVPISHKFRPSSDDEVKKVRKQLDLSAAKLVLLVTGGGNGAARINEATVDCVSELVARYPGLYIVLLTGRGLEAATRHRAKQLLSEAESRHLIIKGFVANLHDYSAAADVIVARAGGSSMAEFAAQAKPCVVVPNPLLAGGHQLKNAQVLAARKAVKMVQEDVLAHDHLALMPPLTELFDDPDKAKALGRRLHELAQPNASHLLAVAVLEVADGASINK